MGTRARKERKRAGVRHEHTREMATLHPWAYVKGGLGLISPAEVQARILARPSR
ncbi:hypothetical protein [Microbacterium stercoris]|uniref:Uncharacterized protein n=1 Tax=Microbacterium stercoris TaxID=2820289 RepID=A0A939TQR1_9MICO|nr:hypothetical protein [Microbacterium stercoris]MBO3663720.1 hypothetical protein [Microbacterium stercoris]